MDVPTEPATPRPAATVLLLRDGPRGIEVFMAGRHLDSSFMPGVLVFPGGAVDPDDSATGMLARHRKRLCAGEATFSAIMAEEGLTPAIDLMAPFARWITPVIRAKRFDARFYLARAPEGQAGLHDERELISSRWITPADALAAAMAREVKIVFVTRSNLSLLAKSRTVDEALAAARARTVVPVQPQLFESPDGPALRIPADAGYDVTEILVRDVGD
jgi:8-oxo-dGTP pyrophosphatase MutT (NUDIX family)